MLGGEMKLWFGGKGYKDSRPDWALLDNMLLYGTYRYPKRGLPSLVQCFARGHSKTLLVFAGIGECHTCL